MYRAILWGFILAISAAAQYVPSGVRLNANTRKIEDVEWDKAKKSPDPQVLQSFISRFPKSRHVKPAERLLDKLTGGERSRAADDTRTYKLVPQGRHVVRAVPDERERQ